MSSRLHQKEPLAQTPKQHKHAYLGNLGGPRNAIGSPGQLPPAERPPDAEDVCGSASGNPDRRQLLARRPRLLHHQLLDDAVSLPHSRQTLP